MTDFGKLVIAGVLVVLAAIGAGVYFLHKQLSTPAPVACTEEAKICPDGSAVGRTGPNCSFAPCPTTATSTLLSDVYPLYSGTWQAAVPANMQVGTTTLAGYKVVSTLASSTNNIADITTPFVNYYDKKLVAAGYKEDKTLDADGAGSSERVYKKGSAIIVLGYTSTFQNNEPNQPAQCPCIVGLSIFSSSN